MKIIVYAICKNEEQFIKRWLASIKDADDIYVLDTGSTDNSFSLLKNAGVHVKKKIITPWRFDVARNEALNMVPKDVDVCVSLDIDEIITPNWRTIIENTWKNDTSQMHYLYHWNHDEDGNPIISFQSEKIHERNNFIWVNAVHEVLKYTGNNYNLVTNNELKIDHYPDNNKSRNSYLPLLELAVRENPENDRNMHYLGREYMYYKQYQKAIETLLNHIKLESATWIDEKAASMRFIARSYMALGKQKEALIWSQNAIDLAPHLRETYMEKALICYDLNDYYKVIILSLQALSIDNNRYSYINEPFSSDYYIYDLLSIIYIKLGFIDIAKLYIKKAIKIKPTKRLINNLVILNNYKG